MRLFELIIEDENVDSVFAISMVNNPAIEAYGTYFSKGEQHFAEVKEEEGLFMAPILIPNKKILRVDGKGTPYEVYFSPETIKRLSQMYLEKKYQDSVTIEHDAKVEGITLVESWIKESVKADKSKMYGLNVPAGSWLGTFKIDNEEMREKFKSGEVSAVSIEGIFEHLEKSSPNRIEAAKLWESYSDFMDKDVEELSEVEADLVIERIKEAIFNKEHLKLESYSDYGDGIKNNAKKGIELNEKNGNKCATQTGKVRAQQLAKGESISLETIKRMHSYLSRAEGEYDKSDDSSACANISYLLWGGKAALSWSRNKLRELGELQEATNLHYIDDLNEEEAKDLLNNIHSMLMPEIEMEGEPSIVSSYPGEVSSGSISPDTL